MVAPLPSIVLAALALTVLQMFHNRGNLLTTAIPHFMGEPMERDAGPRGIHAASAGVGRHRSTSGTSSGAALPRCRQRRRTPSSYR
jgi:hypothetical protein